MFVGSFLFFLILGVPRESLELMRTGTGPLDSHGRLGGASPLLRVPLPSPMSPEKGQHLKKIILVDHTAVGQRLQQVVGQGGFATIGHTVRREKVLETTARYPSFPSPRGASLCL